MIDRHFVTLSSQSNTNNPYNPIKHKMMSVMQHCSLVSLNITSFRVFSPILSVSLLWSLLWYSFDHHRLLHCFLHFLLSSTWFFPLYLQFFFGLVGHYIQYLPTYLSVNLPTCCIPICIRLRLPTCLFPHSYFFIFLYYSLLFFLNQFHLISPFIPAPLQNRYPLKHAYLQLLSSFFTFFYLFLLSRNLTFPQIQSGFFESLDRSVNPI